MTTASTSLTRYPPDRKLSARMGLTMFMLGLVYAGFIAVLIVFIKSLAVVIVIAGGLLFAQYWFSDRIALAAMRAREVTPEQEPRLHGLIDRICATANMDKPRVYVADTDLPNAFATGRNSKRAVICVTTGLSRRLDADEMEGVLSHELSHIAHRDVAVMTIASFLSVAAGLMARNALFASMFRGRRDQNTAIILLVVVAVSVAVYVVSFVLIRALSRYRELAADRAGALVTGRPSALASALTKISGDMARIPDRDLRTAEPLNAFFFAPALRPDNPLSTLLSTHPSLERRLDQLARISEQLGRPA
jgi:heat shock protein HtpX